MQDEGRARTFRSAEVPHEKHRRRRPFVAVSPGSNCHRRRRLCARHDGDAPGRPAGLGVSPAPTHCRLDGLIGRGRRRRFPVPDRESVARADCAPATCPAPPSSAAKPPPALSGGTLLVLRDGKTAFAADPDRDSSSFADLTRAAAVDHRAVAAGRRARAGRWRTRFGTCSWSCAGAGRWSAIDGAVQHPADAGPVCAAPRVASTTTACGVATSPARAASWSPWPGDTLEDRARSCSWKRPARRRADGRSPVRQPLPQRRAAGAGADGRIVERRGAPGSTAANRMAPGRPRRDPLPAAEPGVAWRCAGPQRRRGHVPSGGHQRRAGAVERRLRRRPLPGPHRRGGDRVPCRRRIGEDLRAAVPGDPAGRLRLLGRRRKLALVAAGNDPSTTAGTSSTWTTPP